MATPDDSFSISSERLDGGIRIRPRGDLDIGTTEVLDEELRRAEDGHARIEVDLGELTFMDSTGLQVLLLAHRRAAENGRRMTVLNVPPRVMRLLELTGVLDELGLDRAA